MIRVTFVHHDCFVVELNETILVFDYIPKDALMDSEPPVYLHGKMPILPEDKKLFFFVSNGNKDAFSEEIFSYYGKRSDSHFILPKDMGFMTKTKARYGIHGLFNHRIHRVGLRQNYEIEGLTIYTLNPNTTGVAYLVEAEGITIYHAGDLNWTNWGVEQELYSHLSGSNYKRELKKLQNKHIDLAFVSLDQRLGQAGAKLGFKYFLEHVPSDLVFPMKLFVHYDLIPYLKEDPEIIRLRDKVIDVDREGIVFEIPDDRRR